MSKPRPHDPIESPQDAPAESRPDAQPEVRRYLLRSLNLFGLDHLDAVILAALADERPLLLIGAHGTAKSELLNRLAAALQLEHRHFNASLISFDDLLGYPVPNEARDGLSFLRTPGDLWGAESVLLDEISRCRPETQNKLFCVIHEKRVQGLPLERLRYRWAAMNPPAGEDGPDDGAAAVQDEVYGGVSPLDPALADRFPWVVTVPGLLELSAASRALVIGHGGAQPGPDTGVADLVAAARRRLQECTPAQKAWAAAWVEGLLVPLHEMGLNISGRRAVALVGSALAAQASLQTLGEPSTLPQAALLALRWSLPQRALGRRIDEAALKAAHRLAERAADASTDATWRAIRAEVDPVRRIVLALESGPQGTSRDELSQLVLDALAAQTPAGRHVLALVLSSVFCRGEALSGAASEQLAEFALPMVEVAQGGECVLRVSRTRAAAWDQVLQTITRLEKEGEPRLAEIGNLLYALFAAEADGFEPETAVAQYRQWRAAFHPQAQQEAA